VSKPVVVFPDGVLLYPAPKAAVAAVAEPAGEDRLDEAEGLYCDGTHPRKVDAAFLDRAPRLRVIATAQAGYDNIDVVECTKRKIPFANARGSLTEATADICYLLILSAMRHLNVNLQWVREGRWMKGPAPYSTDLEGARLGIVGMGEIGFALAKRARASGMEIVYNNRHERDDAAQVGATYLGFEELMRTADCVLVLTPLSDATYRMFSTAQFALMKKTAYFVNVARGGVVDTDALYLAVAQNKIAGAALDVTDPEPLPAEHPIMALPNIIVTPHIGSATDQTRERMSLYAAKNILAGLAGERLPQIINPAVYEK
jgi:glyoxylate reductase